MRAIVITGAPGAGKSSVLESLAGLLDNDRVPHAAIESEQFAWGYPWLDEEAAYSVLAGAFRALRGLGRTLFLVAATTETDAHVAALRDAIGVEDVTVVCLVVPPELAARRVLDREPPEWHGRDDLVAAARRLAAEIPALTGIDLRVAGDGRSPREVAREIRRLIAV